MENLTNIPNEEFKKLHETLAQTVINFFKENGLPEDAWMFSFTFDDLESSVKAGEWIPYSDSGIELLDMNRNVLVYRM